MLEKQWRHQLTIQDIRAGINEETLLTEARKTVVEPLDHSPDLRSGIVFYDGNGARIAVVSFDKSGKYGMVDGHPVSFRGGLYDWLSGFFACFR
jgi:hypothetical protein